MNGHIVGSSLAGWLISPSGLFVIGQHRFALSCEDSRKARDTKATATIFDFLTIRSDKLREKCVGEGAIAWLL